MINKYTSTVTIAEEFYNNKMMMMTIIITIKPSPYIEISTKVMHNNITTDREILILTTKMMIMTIDLIETEEMDEWEYHNHNQEGIYRADRINL